MSNIKKLTAIAMAICMLITVIPFSAYAAEITPEISLDEFAEQLSQLKKEYSGNYISELVFDDGTEVYHIDGEADSIYDESVNETVEAVVNDDDFEIPLYVLEENSALYNEENEVEYETAAINEAEDEELEIATVQDAEELGYEVEIDDGTAVLTQPYQTERLIVKSKYNINELDSVAIVEGYNDLHIVQFDSQESAKEALEYYESKSLIEYAEPDLVVSTLEYEDLEESSIFETTSVYDELGINYGNHLSWGSEEIGIDDYVDYIGSIDELSEVVVGIIDTGIDYDHEYLEDRVIRTNYNISTTGSENDEDDDKGHGTHVAGIIVDNTTSNVKVKGYKALNENGTGDLSDAVTAVDYAVADGVNVINMSLSAKGSSTTMENSVKAAVAAGVTVCVSAGNSGSDASKYTPAGIEECITVGAMGYIGDMYGKVGFSLPIWCNWGSLVDIWAPGVSIYSTYMGNSYETLSGTSMSCPFVAAASAMLLSKDISLNSEEICTTLEENGKDLYNDEYDIHCLFLYIATITEFDKDRSAKPEFSVEAGRYSDSITLEITSSDEDAQIYYTTDGSRASKETGTLYTGPIVIDKTTTVHAAAYSGDKLKSLQSVVYYYITYLDDEGNFEIDENGIITAYNGTNVYLTIPDTIAGITVTGIGARAFKDTGMVMIKFPDTLTYVGKYAFGGCSSTLTAVYCNNLQVVEDHGFYQMMKLDTIDLTQLVEVGQYAFSHCTSITSLYNDKLTTIEKCAFNHLSNALYVDLPNVTFVDYLGLINLQSAEYINLPKLQTLGGSALRNAFLVESLDFPELTTLVEQGDGGNQFDYCTNLKEFNAPKLEGIIPSDAFDYCTNLESITVSSNITEIKESAFRSCYLLTSLYFPNAVTIGNEAFKYCYALETLYIPSAADIGTNAFYYANSLKTIFAPSLETTLSLPDCDGVTLYVTDTFTSTTSPEYDYTIVAPSGSYAEEWANENGYTFLSCDTDDGESECSNVTTRGRSICCTAAGLRFGFYWYNIDEIEDFADNIEYGLIYSQKGEEDLSIETVDGSSVKQIEATNRIDHGDNTSFNLVISNIPSSYYDREITARAYVCIDGMYFYSNVLKGSFGEVANLVLADDEIDEATKNAVNNLLNRII